MSTLRLPLCGVKKQEKATLTINLTANPIQYAAMLIALFLVLLCFGLLPNMYLMYLKTEVGFNQVILGNIFTINGVLIVLLQIPITQCLQKINNKLKSLVGILLIGLGVGSVQFVQTQWQLYLSTLLWTLGEIILFVPILKELLKLSPWTQGKTVACYPQAFSISEMLAPILGGAIVLIAYQALWNLVLILSALAMSILLMLYLMEKKYEHCIN